MKTALDLLNEVVAMGFEREEALGMIDADLDAALEKREVLTEETITDELYNDILDGFKCELEGRNGVL